MGKIETLEEFYKEKFKWVPENLRKEIGHFNVFRLDTYVGNNAQPVPYKRRDFYKIMLIICAGLVHYADKIIEVKKQAISFSNPLIPYKWEHLENVRSGFFCIFNQSFFLNFGDLNQYPVFQPDGMPIFELTDVQVIKVKGLYERMFEELDSDYRFKYDVLRNLVYELLHFALKMQPSTVSGQPHINASQRISLLFLELLEWQFPIDESHRRVYLRSASGFANQLNVHVNHLNRAIRETTQKTTTQLIAERILRESRILLKHSAWNVSEIAYALGFTEVTHFNNFFKKHTKMSPLKFRNV